MSKEPIRLNLGSGGYNIRVPGWTNIEMDPTIPSDLCADVMDLDAHYKPKSVDEIYAGHMLEHAEDAPKALRYWRSLLKPGRPLTLTLPNPIEGLRMYLSGEGNAMDIALDIAYGRGGAHLHWNDIPGLGDRSHFFATGAYHRNGLTPPVTMALMRDAGYSNVKQITPPSDLIVCEVSWQYSVVGLA